ncbi:MAG: hypothetical protein JOZ46_07735 [Candidatus Dormibacteraeota bacterium]|nr:hypothetical protein [Candidatus Dormibacteraeota bacterium]MBV9525690.1 hypothetical protein [Candidatus Dormibacteraeota bacterium]
MAARTAAPAAIGFREEQAQDTAASRAFPIPADGAVEVLGRAIKGAGTQLAPSNGQSEATAEETMRALRLLALDNLIDLVQLRETLAEREAQVHILEAEVASWRQRALSETVARKTDASEAYARQRELVTVLHRQLTQNDELQAQLESSRRRSWWRRLLRRA